ncbi:MAG: hypothetical protein ACKOTZ_13705 [Chloroflexota bacterium]
MSRSTGARRGVALAVGLALAAVPFISSSVAAEDATEIIGADHVAAIMAAHEAEEGHEARLDDHEALVAEIMAADEAGLAAIIAELTAWDEDHHALHALLEEAHDDVQAALVDGECHDALEAALIMDHVEEVIRTNIIEALTAGTLEDAHGHLEDYDEIHHEPFLDAAQHGWLVACGFEAAA